MIIVKTSNGDVFLNEKEYKTIPHNKEMRTVILVKDIGQMQTKTDVIENVEAIRYISDAQPLDYTDRGSLLTMYRELVELQESWIKAILNTRGIERINRPVFFQLLYDIVDQKELPSKCNWEFLHTAACNCTNMYDEIKGRIEECYAEEERIRKEIHKLLNHVKQSEQMPQPGVRQQEK